LKKFFVLILYPAPNIIGGKIKVKKIPSLKFKDFEKFKGEMKYDIVDIIIPKIIQIPLS
jgi:hypothetical protein